mmetsp:Transcript_753/g.2138  ORF Transcript_753/g.2138 Transcript_753/m.2138 type:complete len:114 (+) Transcript_753:289-630(+)
MPISTLRLMLLHMDVIIGSSTLDEAQVGWDPQIDASHPRTQTGRHGWLGSGPCGVCIPCAARYTYDCSQSTTRYVDSQHDSPLFIFVESTSMLRHEQTTAAHNTTIHYSCSVG